MIKKRYLPFILLCVTLILGATITPHPQPSKSNGEFELVIIHTNDFHGYDYDLLARKSTIIRDVRAKHAHVLLLEGGDIFSRGKYHHQFYGTLEMDVLNLMRYDAWVLGNNEMKCSPTEEETDRRIKTLVEMANFPTLGGNMTLKSTNDFFPGTRPYTIIDRGGVKIAIISTTSMKIKGYAQAKNKQLTDPLLSARKQLKEVSPKSDIQILLSHSGILADKIMGDTLGLEGLDGIVGSDTHIALEKPLISTSGVPIVQAGGEFNQYVGVLKLYFRKKNNQWKLVRSEGELIRPDGKTIKDKETEQIINTYLERLK